MKSTFIKEKEKNVLPSVVFEFNPTAKVERKNLPPKRPFSASSSSSKNLLRSEKENKNSNNNNNNKLIRSNMALTMTATNFNLQGDMKNYTDTRKLVPSLKKLTRKPESVSHKLEIKQMQDKCIVREKLPKPNRSDFNVKNHEDEKMANFSNFDDDSMLKENGKNTNEVDFHTIFNKFMEEDEVEFKENKIKEKSIKLEKLSSSVELFVKNFEKAGLERHPVKIPSKKSVENKLELKKAEYEAKNMEGKTAAEVFQHFKNKFGISEMFAKNLQQIKELKKNFQSIKEEDKKLEEAKKEIPKEDKKVEVLSKIVQEEHSFEEVTYKENKNTDQNQYQSSKANDLLQLYKESLEEDGEYQELQKHNVCKETIEEELGESSVQEQNQIKEQKNSLKQTKKEAKKVWEEVKGNHNEFMGEKDAFDMKRFIESTDPEVKKTQKEKIEAIIKKSLMPGELKRLEINSQHNKIRRFVPSEADPNQPKKKMTAENLQAMIKIAKMEQEKDNKKVNLKEEREQKSLNKILANKIKSVNDVLVAKKN